ncbi:hypothetical protein SBRCBS47491_002146 [Sporothrix bragantina]|uniref:Uncharacterized protein n=1 Tax=Sporothrix bragantina TaxID=671064 RepID=A0ABP0B4K3_9PEZI
MATQVDSLNRGSQLKPFRPWRHRDTAHGHSVEQDAVHDDSLTSADHHPPPSAMHRISEANTARRRPQHPQPATREQHHRPQSTSQHLLVSSPASPALNSPRTTPRQSHENKPETSSPTPSPSSSSSPSHPLPTSTKVTSDDVLDAATPRTIVPSTFDPEAAAPLSPSPQHQGLLSLPSRPSLKRRRALSDVDGPNTADLCCKKRRLRRFLITSRLSQPFSQPATHILNRESVALGDRRFLKLAAIMNARRIARGPLSSSSSASSHTPSPSEVLRRAAMANRLRLRIFSGPVGVAAVAGNGKLVLRNSGGHPVVAAVPVTPVSTSSSGTTTAAEVASSAVFARSSGGSSNSSNLHSLPHPRPAWKPASSSSYSTANSMHFVRALSRSPKLRPVRDRDQTAVPPLEVREPKDLKEDTSFHADDDDFDDDECAFPTSEHETRYEANDDVEDVYADFSVLFNSSALADSDGDGGESGSWAGSDLDGLDDYMDELDGIAHLPR